MYVYISIDCYVPVDRCSLQNSEPGIRNSELVYFKELGILNWCILRNSELVYFTEFEPLTAPIIQFIPGDPNP